MLFVCAAKSLLIYTPLAAFSAAVRCLALTWAKIDDGECNGRTHKAYAMTCMYNRTCDAVESQPNTEQSPNRQPLSSRLFLANCFYLSNNGECMRQVALVTFIAKWVCVWVCQCVCVCESVYVFRNWYK